MEWPDVACASSGTVSVLRRLSTVRTVDRAILYASARGLVKAAECGSRIFQYDCRHVARYVRLSHEIRGDDPRWPGNPTYSWEQFSSIPSATSRSRCAPPGHPLRHRISTLRITSTTTGAASRTCRSTASSTTGHVSSTCRRALVRCHSCRGPRGRTKRLSVTPTCLLMRTGWGRTRVTRRPARYAGRGTRGIAGGLRVPHRHPGLKAARTRLRLARRVPPSRTRRRRRPPDPLRCRSWRPVRDHRRGLDLAGYPGPRPVASTRSLSFPRTPTRARAPCLRSSPEKDHDAGSSRRRSG